MATCPMPHKVEQREVAALDLITTTIPVAAGCYEITTWLYEHEPASHGFESWPQAVQTRVRSIIEEWLKANPACKLIAVTHAIVPARGNGRNAVTLLHHGPKPKG